MDKRLIRLTLSRIAAMQSDLSLDVKAVMAYVEKGAAPSDWGNLEDFKLTKQTLQPFILQTLKKYPQIYDPRKINLESLSWALFRALSKPNFWKLLKDWSESEVEETIVNNARGLVGLHQRDVVAGRQPLTDIDQIVKVIEKFTDRRIVKRPKGTVGTNAYMKTYHPDHVEYQITLPVYEGEGKYDLEKLHEDLQQELMRSYGVWTADDMTILHVYRGRYDFTFHIVVPIP